MPLTTQQSDSSSFSQRFTSRSSGNRPTNRPAFDSASFDDPLTVITTTAALFFLSLSLSLSQRTTASQQASQYPSASLFSLDRTGQDRTSNAAHQLGYRLVASCTPASSPNNRHRRLRAVSSRPLKGFFRLLRSFFSFFHCLRGHPSRHGDTTHDTRCIHGCHHHTKITAIIHRRSGDRTGQASFRSLQLHLRLIAQGRSGVWIKNGRTVQAGQDGMGGWFGNFR